MSHQINVPLNAFPRRERVIIIIPTYNEALVIEETIRQVFSTLSNDATWDAHVLIFDSASTDNTQSIVQSLMPQYHHRLFLQTEPKKTGLGSAYLQAMNYALYALDAEVVVEFDADLSHQPKYLHPLLHCLKTCDVAMGSRYVPGGSIPKDWGFHRKFISVLGNYITRWVLTMKYKDFTTGFRATRREALIQALPPVFLSNHYAYKLHLLWLLHKHNALIQEIPIHFIDRTEGVSKLPKNSINDSLRVIFTLRWHEIKTWFTHTSS